MKYLKNYLNESLNIPKTLYHASNKLFNKFELKRGYRSELFSVEEKDSYAIFLTDDINAAKEYGEKYLYKCEVKCDRTLDWKQYLDIRTYSYIKNNFGNIIPWSSSEYWMLLDDKRVVNYLNIRKIDCIILEEINKSDPFTTYAVFNPNNIQIVDIKEI